MRVLDVVSGIVFLGLVVVAMIYTRKNKSFEEFTVSDRKLNMGILFSSLSATFIGPAFSLSLVNQGYNNGYVYLLIASFYGVAKMVEASIAGKLRIKFKNANSIGDVIAGKDSHNNKWLHIMVGLISFGLLIGFAGVITKAGGELLNSFFNLDKIYGIIIIAIIVSVYSFFGGLKASVYTDAIQFLIFVVLIPILLISVLNSSEFEYSHFEEHIIKLTKIGYNQFSNWDLVGLIITWFLGEMFIPPTVSRMLASKNAITSKRALSLSGLFMIVWLILMLTLGIVAKTNQIELKEEEQVLLKLGRDYLSSGLYGIFIVAIISIVMSSLDSIINAASIAFTQDIVRPLKRVGLKKSLKLARLATLVVTICSIALAIYFDTILNGLLTIYAYWAPSIIVVLVTSVILKKQFWQAAIGAMLGGIVSTFITTKLNLEVPPILMGLIIGMLFYVVIHNYKIKNERKKETV